VAFNVKQFKGDGPEVKGYAGPPIWVWNSGWNKSTKICSIEELIRGS